MKYSAIRLSSMSDMMQFEDIRPYSDGEMWHILRSLMEDDGFVKLLETNFPMVSLSDMVKREKDITSVTQFQKSIIYPVLVDFVSKTSAGVTSSGLENISGGSTLIMSNHRDIVMDPTLLALVLIRNFGVTCEIAIGNNLLANKWITDFVRLNKCFIVKRGLTPREMPKAFSQLSAYIRHAVTEKNVNVWIAQREGRAKNSDDRTQESLVKMFALSGKGDFISDLKALNITPLTISYEFDPCDYLKAAEMQRRRDSVEFKKLPGEDVLSMKTGISGYKGRVHYAFSHSINDRLDEIAASVKNRKEQAAAVCALCDRQIHLGYEIYPINRWAYAALTGDRRFDGVDSEDDMQNAEKYLRGQLAKITLDNRDEEFLWNRLLEMYANPLKNHLAALHVDL